MILTDTRGVKITTNLVVFPNWQSLAVPTMLCSLVLPDSHPSNHRPQIDRQIVRPLRNRHRPPMPYANWTLSDALRIHWSAAAVLGMPFHSPVAESAWGTSGLFPIHVTESSDNEKCRSVMIRRKWLISNVCYHIVVLQTVTNKYWIVLAKKFNVPGKRKTVLSLIFWCRINLTVDAGLNESNGFKLSN